MKLCAECKHEEMKVLSPGKTYRCCKILSDKSIEICHNAREESGPCGPEAKFWEPK
jgi:hypothetical protein